MANLSELGLLCVLSTFQDDERALQARLAEEREAAKEAARVKKALETEERAVEPVQSAPASPVRPAKGGNREPPEEPEGGAKKKRTRSKTRT